MNGGTVHLISPTLRLGRGTQIRGMRPWMPRLRGSGATLAFGPF